MFAANAGFINIARSYLDERQLLKIKGIVGHQTYHVFHLIVPCTVPAWGILGKRRMTEPRGASALCQRFPTTYFAPTETSVDCPEPAESHWGESPEIRADKLASTCERKHVTHIQQCHIRPTPQRVKRQWLNC